MTFLASCVCVFGYKLYDSCRWILSGLFSLHLADAVLLVMEGGKKGIFEKLFSIYFSRFSFIVVFEPWAVRWHVDVFGILINIT